MATFTKVLLSGSTDGKPILIGATSSPGTTVHTAHAAALDEIWLWASNLSGGAVNIVVEWGGTTDPDHLLTKTYSLPAGSGAVQIAPGLLLTNSLLVKVYAGTTNVITVHGFVNRIA